MKGKIVKGISGFYYIHVVESGNSFYNFSLHIFLLITTVISITGILAVIS